MIRDRLVAGLCDRALSEQLQMDPELTLDKAIACIYQSERMKKQQELPEEAFKANNSASDISGVLSCSQQTSQENVDESLDTDDVDNCIESSNPGGGKPHHCSYCGSSFQKVRDLMRHQRTHTGEKPHHCPVCNKSFARLDKLKLHQEIHTGVKPHSCPDCEKSFARLDKLQLHQRTHTGVKSHHCPDCDRSFSRLDKLNSHKKSHGTETVNFHPTDSLKDIKTSSKVRESRTYQSRIKATTPREEETQDTDDSDEWTPRSRSGGEKPHYCSDCGRSFRKVRDLMRHQRTHTGEKPHHCPVCNRGFARLDKLKLHQEVHTGVKPHSCPDCEKSFARLDNLKLHQKIHMKKELNLVALKNIFFKNNL
uniref:C2H2-type domain-containing protein n=1 Tax=Esox lucius TaxID=8010 RepID=A0A3P9AN04_ESOLU